MFRGLPRQITGCVAILTSFILVGCAKGVAEYQLYAQSFDIQYAEGQLVLDRLARAERIVVRRQLQRQVGASTFDPSHAGYYVSSGDPPITGSIRASFKSLKDYNAALSALGNGEAAQALAGRVGTLSLALVQAGVSLGVASGVVPSVGAGGRLVGSAAGAVNQAIPIFQRIAAVASREAVRKELVRAYPAMRDLSFALRNGTPEMFEIMRRSYVQRGSLETTTGISVSDAAALEKDRELLAGWVLLMDKGLAALKAAAVAAMSGASSTDLAALTAASVELQILAAQIGDLRKQ